MRTKLNQIKISDDYLEFLNFSDSIKQLENKRKIKCDNIVRRFSPYAKDTAVIYKRNTDIWNHHGIIKKVNFNPGNGVDGVWEILIQPTNKKFKPYNKKTQLYLNHIHDRIIKLIKKAP